MITATLHLSLGKFKNFTLSCFLGLIFTSPSIGQESEKLKIPKELETNKEIRIYFQTLEEVVHEYIVLEKKKIENSNVNETNKNSDEGLDEAVDALDVTLKLYEVTQRIQQLTEEGQLHNIELSPQGKKAFSEMYANIIKNLSSTDGKIVSYDYDDFSNSEDDYTDETGLTKNNDENGIVQGESTEELTKTKVNPRIYISGLLITLIGVGLSLVGLRKFGLAYALSFFLVSISILAIFDWASITMISITLALAVTMFLFTTPLTYFFSWLFGAVMIALPFSMIYDTIGIDPESSIYKLTVYISMGAAIILIYFIRKHLKAILIGAASGFYVGFGIAIIIFGKLIENNQWLDAVTAPYAIIYTGMIIGLAFQYYYVIKKHPELVEVNIKTHKKSEQH